MGELFQEEDIRAVFLATEEVLFLPERIDLKPGLGQKAAAVESESSRSLEERGDLIQDTPAVSRGEIEDFLSSQYSQSEAPETKIDPEILNRFSLDRTEKTDFSLVYNPDSLTDLEKNPIGRIQRGEILGLSSSSAWVSGSGLSGRLGPSSPAAMPSLPFGQTYKRIQIKDLTPWAEKVLEKIEGFWKIQPVDSRGIKRTVIISVTITKSGDISNVEVVKSSGDPELDASAVNAVNRSLPLPGLPIMYPAKTITITIEFEYDV